MIHIYIDDGRDETKLRNPPATSPTPENSSKHQVSFNIGVPIRHELSVGNINYACMRAMLQPGHSISDCGGGTDLIDIIEQMYPKAVGIATSSCTYIYIYTCISNKFRIRSSHTIAGRPAKAKNITDVLDIWIVPRSIEQRPLNPQCGMHTYQLGPSELYEIKKHAGMHVCDQICIPGTVRV